MDEQSHRRYETPGMRHEGLPIHQGHIFLEVTSVCLLLCGGAGHWQHHTCKVLRDKAVLENLRQVLIGTR